MWNFEKRLWLVEMAQNYKRRSQVSENNLCVKQMQPNDTDYKINYNWVILTHNCEMKWGKNLSWMRLETCRFKIKKKLHS